MLYLPLLMPLTVVEVWNSVRVSNATDLAYFIGFFVFSAGAGLVIGYVRWLSAESSYYLSVLAAYVGGVAAAVYLAASQTPPLVEIRADRNVTLACSKVPPRTHVRDARQVGLVLVPLQQQRGLVQPARRRGGYRAFPGVPEVLEQRLTPKRRH